MTHRLARAGGFPSAHSGWRTQSPHRGVRRLGVAALAAGTFLGLGAMVGPVGIANAGAGPGLSVTVNSGENFAAAFNEGSNIVLGTSVIFNDSLTLGSSTTLTIDLAGNNLELTGTTPETAGEGGGAAVTIPSGSTLRIVNSGSSGTATFTGGNGHAGADGCSADNYAVSGDEACSDGGPMPGDDGGAGGTGVAIADSGTLVVDNATVNATGGAGGTGGDGGKGETPASDGRNGDGGDGISNGGVIIAFSTDGVTGVAGGENGADWIGNSTFISFIAGEAVGPTAVDVYAATLGGAISAIAALDPAWPTRAGYEFAGWFDGETEYDAESATTIGGDQTLTAHWTAKSTPPPAAENGGGAPPTTAAATTSSSASTTTTTAAITTSKAPATTTTKPAAPTSTSTSIPTNNVANPVTFTSTSAPAPQPLPGVSEVNDSSASQFDVDTHTPTQGGDLVLTAHGFKPGSVVDFWMHSTPVYLGSAIADVHGVAVLPIQLTPALVGNHHVQSIGTGLLGEPRNLAQPITIAPAPALASTGIATGSLALLALLLLAGGAALLFVDRRRGAARHLTQ